MKNVTLFFATLVPFLLLDAAMIAAVVLPMYKRNISHLLSSSPNIPVAVIWYILYVSGVVYFAVRPAVQRGKPALAVLNGGALGAVSYGTLALTNLAILNAWPWHIAVMDTLWGTVLTGVSAYAAVAIANKLAPAEDASGVLPVSRPLI